MASLFWRERESGKKEERQELESSHLLWCWSLQLGRLAVLKRCRSLGLGAKLIQSVTDYTVEKGRKEEKGEAMVWCFAMVSIPSPPLFCDVREKYRFRC